MPEGYSPPSVRCTQKQRWPVSFMAIEKIWEITSNFSLPCRGSYSLSSLGYAGNTANYWVTQPGLSWKFDGNQLLSSRGYQLRGPTYLMARTIEIWYFGTTACSLSCKSQVEQPMEIKIKQQNQKQCTKLQKLSQTSGNYLIKVNPLFW